MELTGIQGQIPGGVHLLRWIDAATWVEIVKKSIFDGVKAVWNLYVGNFAGKKNLIADISKILQQPCKKINIAWSWDPQMKPTYYRL